MGGNVFSGKTSTIKKEHIKPTLNSYFKDLKSIFKKKSHIFNFSNMILLGSAGKKSVSNDIDLGVDINLIIDDYDKSILDWGLDPKAVREEFELLSSRARTATPDHLRKKAFLKEMTRYINTHAPTLYFDEKKVSNGNVFSLYPQIDQKGNQLGQGVQIDWMIGNIDWLKFSYYSSAYPESSNVKGLHRTQLILSAFQVAELSFNHVDGIKDKITGAIVADTPETALDVLGDRLGFNLSISETRNYYTLHDRFKNRMKKDDYQKMIDIYFKILDSTRADIPDNLQGHWCNVKDRLSLTGKFLPDTSKLKVYIV